MRPVSDLHWRRLDFSSGGDSGCGHCKMVAVPVLLACLLTIIRLPLSLGQQGLVRRRVVTQVSYSEPRRRVVRVRKKRPRVVVVQQRNRLDTVPAVYPDQFGGRDSLSGLPPPVVHPAVVQPGLSSTAFQPRTAYLPAAGPANVYQNPSYRPRLGNSGRRSGVPLPKCSYINTDFPGDDLYLDGATSAGLNAGSARACKARCKLEELCNFWTYREGDNRDTLTRDCFLKEGTPGECHFSNVFTHIAIRTQSDQSSVGEVKPCV